MKQGSVVISVLLFWTVAAMAQDSAVIARSGPDRVSLLEVFSSEGCSSCPPAEKWISRLAQEPGLWKDYVPVVFHVDYWDRLGWKDVFADPTYTARQSAYASSWRSNSIYTPGLVLNGREWRGWIGTAEPQLSDRSKDAGVLVVSDTGNGGFEITYESDAENTLGLYAHAAILGSGIESVVRSGENAGQTLRHDFTVLDFSEEPMKRVGSKWAVTLYLKPTPGAPKRSIAAWVSEKKSSEPIQAVGADIV